MYKSGPATAVFTAMEVVRSGYSAALIAPSAMELRRFRSLLSVLLPDNDLPFWRRSWTALPSCAPGDPSPAFWAGRWAFLHFAAEAVAPKIFVFTAENLLPKWPRRESLDDASLFIGAGEELSRELLLEQAVSWGYKRTPMVAGPGEISVRGDILDIHPPGCDAPVRFEFFGDMVEHIRRFDPATQRSLNDLENILLLPVAPAVLSERSVRELPPFWDAMAGTGELPKDARLVLEEKLAEMNGAIWPGLLHDKPAALADWLPKNTVSILYRASELTARLEESEYAWRRFFAKKAEEGGPRWPVQRVLRPLGGAREALFAGRNILFEDLVIGRKKHGPDMPEKSLETFSDLFWKPGADRRPWSTLVAALKDWRTSRRQVILSFHGERSRKKFLGMAENEGLVFSTRHKPNERGLYALVSPLKKGADLEWADILLLPEDILGPERQRTGALDRKRAFTGLSSFDEIENGDLIVHRDYGVAAFQGLARMSVDNTGGDYLLLQFSGDDRLYLPVDRLGLIQRYKGPEGVVPPLDKLGGTRWRTARSKAQKAVEKIAHELVEMYAYRKVAKGYAYGPVDDLYWEFEAGFGFEETPDQEKAIKDVLADMEKSEPMDRLVCGDVGFGKTEVALRAVFRAVLDGKQAALLCPTTVLAEQHYQNFSSRLEGFPVRVGMLSRFVGPKQRKMTLEAARKGEIDILIGTHRLLSKDVELPNLGLLVLDEEQRFGVKHKEKLKAMRKNIDVLTLTATPIPRTLQLSLSGIRGLSVIETPPAERKAVETGLVERDPGFLRGVLARELERGGQVFWVHNRIEGLERTVEFVQSLAPDARVGMAHGRMPESRLEKAMHEFWRSEIDILVCTAIIESGLDFPRANTLVVDQAQMFGLGQLYQLRGRVGRSSRQAYAYFVVSSLESIPETARKRLRVIMDMDYLGAGFKVAMEDLRLRGAGNILGEVQSGRIAKIGLDLFLEMLDQEVRRLKGDPVREQSDPEITIGVPARIPETYVADPKERLGLYKALSSARDETGLAEMAAELRDRFGAVPEEVDNFIAVLLLKQTLSKLFAVRAEVFPGKLVADFDPEAGRFSPKRLVAWIETRNGDAKLFPPAKLELRLDRDVPFREALRGAALELSQLLDARSDQGVGPTAT